MGMTAPIGVFIDCGAVLLGGTIGVLSRRVLSTQMKNTLSLFFSIGAMAMSFTSIIKVSSMPAIILSLLVGAAIGQILRVEKRIRWCGSKMAGFITKRIPLESSFKKEDDDYLNQFTVAVLLFCTGALGIYAAMEASLSGNHSVLIAKAVLDFFTAIIFAARIGSGVIFLAVPQFAILMFFHLTAGFFSPLVSPQMLRDFSACGGMLLLATGFRMAEIKQYPVANALPALVLVMPVSYLLSLVGM